MCGSENLEPRNYTTSCKCSLTKRVWFDEYKEVAMIIKKQIVTNYLRTGIQNEGYHGPYVPCRIEI